MFDLFDLLSDTIDMNEELLNALGKQDKKEEKNAQEYMIDFVQNLPENTEFFLDGKPTTREKMLKRVKSDMYIKSLLGGKDVSYAFGDKLPFDDIDDCPPVDPPMYGIPDIDKIFINKPYTTIKWMDGTVTKVRCADDQEWDRYAGFCAAVTKKLFGSSGEAKKILDMADENAYKERLAAERTAKKQLAEEKAREQAVKATAEAIKHFDDEVYQRTYDLLVEEAAQNYRERLREQIMNADKHREPLQRTSDDFCAAKDLAQESSAESEVHED